MSRIGIMGGSFNPVHVGHISVARHVRELAGLDSVHLMLSPLNPLKAEATGMLDDNFRMDMLEIATRDVEGLVADPTELTMPKPSYTIHTLNHLQRSHPDDSFTLIIGSDNWLLFDKWMSHDEIIERFGVIVYPRPGYPVDESKLPEGVRLINAPVSDISSTWLRQQIAAGVDVNKFLPKGVDEYISENKLYRC